eukprot:COSAG06_NODE_2790_length_6281_cov_5.721126_4_plen_231_part_00
MRSCFLRPTGRRAARGAPPPRPTQRCPSAYPMRSAAPPGRPDTSSDASCIIVQASTSWAGGQHGRMSATGLLFRSRSARFLVSSVHRTRTARAQPQVERWRLEIIQAQRSVVAAPDVQGSLEQAAACVVSPPTNNNEHIDIGALHREDHMVPMRPCVTMMTGPPPPAAPPARRRSRQTSRLPRHSRCRRSWLDAAAVMMIRHDDADQRERDAQTHRGTDRRDGETDRGKL